MTKRVKMVRGSNNVFRDLGFPGGQARNLLLRSQIMICIEQFVERSGLTQGRAAALLGLTQPRLNALLKGKVDQFSLDALEGFRALIRTSPQSLRSPKSARSRTRTGTALRPRDFKSLASTDFATRARAWGSRIREARFYRSWSRERRHRHPGR